MAVAAVLVDSGHDTTVNGPTFTTPTPVVTVAGRLYVLSLYVSGIGTSPDPTVTLPGTMVEVTRRTVLGPRSQVTVVYRCTAGGNATMTWSNAAAYNWTSTIWALTRLTGHNDTTPVVQSNATTGTSTGIPPTWTITLPGSVTAGNALLSAYSYAVADTATPAGGGVEVYDQVETGAPVGALTVQFDDTPADNAMAASWTTAATARAVLFEIAASAGVGPHTGTSSGTLVRVGSAAGQRPGIVVSTVALISSVTVVATDTDGHRTRSTLYYAIPHLIPGAPGQASGAILRHGTATGVIPVTGHSGFTTGAVVKAGSAVGARPVVRVPGTGVGLVVKAGSATGARPLIGKTGTGTGAVLKSGTVTGFKPVTAVANPAVGAVVWAGISTGVKPVIAKTGTATGAFIKAGSATGARPIHRTGTATGVVTKAGSATGQKPGATGKVGQAAGLVVKAGSATGVKPTITPPGGKRFRTDNGGSWYERPLPTNAPIHANNSTYINALNTVSSPNYLAFTGGSDYPQGGTGDFSSPLYRVTAADPNVFLYSAGGSQGVARFGVGGEGLRIPEVAKTHFKVGTASSDAPLGTYDATRGYYTWMSKIQWNPTSGHWEIIAGGSVSIYKTSSYGQTADSPAAGCIWPAQLVGSNRAPTFYRDDTENGGHRGCNSMARQIDYDRVQSQNIVPYVTEMFIYESGNQGRWPMNNYETRSGIIPEGTRLRINPTVDVGGLLDTDTAFYGTPGSRTAAQTKAYNEALAVAKSLQTYGIMVGDNSAAGCRVKLESTFKEGRGNLWTVKKDGLRKLTFNLWQVIADFYDPL